MAKTLYSVHGADGYDMGSRQDVLKGIFNDLDLAVKCAKDDPYGASVYEVGVNAVPMKRTEIWGYREALAGGYSRGFLDHRDEEISPELAALHEQAAKFGMRVTKR